MVKKAKNFDCEDKTAQLPALKKRLSSLFAILDRWDKDYQSINPMERKGKHDLGDK